MLNNIKALVIVLTLGLGVWWVARSFCLRAMSLEDFNRRRLIWVTITVFVFTSPNFWIFCFLTILLLMWAMKREQNPLALYLLILYAAPYVHLYIPVVGINQLFDLSYQRLLGFCILIPTLMRLRAKGFERGKQEPPRRALQLADVAIVSYCALQVILWLPLESVTAAGRRGFLLFIDIVLPYLAFSRAITSSKSLTESMYCFVLGAAILAPLAVFESARNWMLYVIVGANWGAVQDFAFLFRAGSLRAQVTAGHALYLGYIFAIAFGFWLYLQREETSKMRAVGVSLWLWLGLFAAYSRGPWITAVAIMFVYYFLMPKGITRTIKALAATVMGGLLILLTPLGGRLLKALPFVGSVDKENVTYRQDLLDSALRLIPQHPWLGDRFVMNQLEHLRQGQGIIDMVNGFVVVVLYYGLIGLLLVSIFLLSPLAKGYFASRRAASSAPDSQALGLILVACMIGSFLHIAMTAFDLMMWAISGMLIAYSTITNESLAAAADMRRSRATPLRNSRPTRGTL